ncbi:hypothetical protein MN608_02008 [Microdochium nivale]|nr:hypothetical protein MN608_02008 [Microdochium nivale]
MTNMSDLAKKLGLGRRQVDAILREKEAQAEAAAAAAERRSIPVRYHHVELQPHAGFQRWLSAGIEKTRDQYGVAPSAAASRVLAQQQPRSTVAAAAAAAATAGAKPVTYKTVRRIRGAIRIDMGNIKITHTPSGDLAVTKTVRNRARTAVMPSARAPMPTVHQLEKRSEAYRLNGGIVKSRRKKLTCRSSSSVISQPAPLPNIWDARRQSDKFHLPTPPATPTKPTSGGSRATYAAAPPSPSPSPPAPSPLGTSSETVSSRRPAAHTGLAIGCDQNLNRSLQRPAIRKDALPPKTTPKRKARELTCSEESISDDDDKNDDEDDERPRRGSSGSQGRTASHFVLNGKRLPKSNFIIKHVLNAQVAIRSPAARSGSTAPTATPSRSRDTSCSRRSR